MRVNPPCGAQGFSGWRTPHSAQKGSWVFIRRLWGPKIVTGFSVLCLFLFSPFQQDTFRGFHAFSKTPVLLNYAHLSIPCSVCDTTAKHECDECTWPKALELHPSRAKWLAAGLMIQLSPGPRGRTQRNMRGRKNLTHERTETPKTHTRTHTRAQTEQFHTSMWPTLCERACVDVWKVRVQVCKVVTDKCAGEGAGKCDENGSVRKYEKLTPWQVASSDLLIEEKLCVYFTWRLKMKRQMWHTSGGKKSN